MMNKMSSITFPDGSSYEVTDDKARKDITELNSNLEATNENVVDVQTQINEVQVIKLKEGATLYVNGKVGLIRFNGLVFKNGELLLDNEKAKYRPIISSSGAIRVVDNSTINVIKFYDGLGTINEDGTVNLTYLQSEGVSSGTQVTNDNCSIYGTVMYIIK